MPFSVLEFLERSTILKLLQQNCNTRPFLRYPTDSSTQYIYKFWRCQSCVLYQPYCFHISYNDNCTFFGEAGNVLSKLLEVPAFQIHRELEQGDSLWAADRPRAGHHPTGRLHLLQELKEHWERKKRLVSQKKHFLTGSHCWAYFAVRCAIKVLYLSLIGQAAWPSPCVCNVSSMLWRSLRCDNRRESCCHSHTPPRTGARPSFSGPSGRLKQKCQRVFRPIRWTVNDLRIWVISYCLVERGCHSSPAAGN